ncbi:hypothetical protein CALCODRAFT_490494 [Calocera cornea HHB12733]|uniref:Uncharacterized protein n=1 Tax=Calocera cornea HHB12733 TaxID=1353952 RepID=A0A165JKL4_9BASI|nr:hypothetical protein CALCODRAFT_490494 [Calocera cornea HHB12733]
MQLLRTIIFALFAFSGIALAIPMEEMTNAERLARGLPPAAPKKLARAGPRAPTPVYDVDRVFEEYYEPEGYENYARPDATEGWKSSPSGLHRHPEREWRSKPSGFPHHNHDQWEQ